MSKNEKKIKIKLSTVVNLLISLGMLLIAGGVGVFLAFYNTYSPEKYMDEYYECFLNESYSALFKSSEVEESEFISAEMFAQMMVNEYGYEETDKYSISEVVKKGDYATSTVSFVDSETVETVKWDLKLQKSKDKKHLFFNEWQVNIDEFIIENIVITADEEVEVVIDDINITSDEVNGVSKTLDEDTGKVTYNIERMFMGTHSVLFAGKHTVPESQLITFDKDNMGYECISGGTLQTEAKDGMSSATTNIIVEMYNSAFTEADGATLTAMFSTKAGVSEKVMEVYNAMLASINKEDGSTLSSIDITDYSITFGDYNYNEQMVTTFDYTASFTAKAARTLNDGVRESYEGVVNAQASITFEYIEDSWQAVGIDMQCIDYSQPEEEE